MRVAVASVVTLVGIASSSRAQPPHADAQPAPGAGRGAARAAIAGCYAFFDRAGRPAAESLYWGPATARLDTTGRAVRLTPRFDAGRPSGPGAYRWSVTPAGDSIRVLFHSGFSGTEFVLALASGADTLRGRAREDSDSGPPFERDAGPASAVRIACPGPAGAGRP